MLWRVKGCYGELRVAMAGEAKLFCNTLGGSGHFCKDARQIKQCTQNISQKIGIFSVTAVTWLDRIGLD